MILLPYSYFRHCDSYPPSWILGELLTMGNVNMVYRNLKADKIRKGISHYFGLQPIVLESWITSLTPSLEAQAGDSYKPIIQKKAMARFKEMS